MDGNPSGTGLCGRITYQRTKVKSPGQLVFGQDMILPINHVADWRYIRQHKQAQIDRDVICENTTRSHKNYRLEYKIMNRTKSAYKYKTPFKVSREIVQVWKNVLSPRERESSQ